MNENKAAGLTAGDIARVTSNKKTNKQRLIENLPMAIIYYYPSIKLNGDTEKEWCVTVDGKRFTAKTESRACKKVLVAYGIIKLKEEL